jgi:DNA-binding beta-propeller fold protein YncE
MLAKCFLAAALLVFPIHLPRSHSADVVKALAAAVLPDLEGPIAHMAVDVIGQRIFVAATGNNSIEIFDAQTLRHLNSITGLSQPQDLVFTPESGNLLVSNAADGSLRTYDTKTLKLLDSKLMGGDADHVRIANGGKSVLVGWGVGSLAVLDTKTGRRSDIQLRSHPDSFQVDSIGNHIFVNLPGVGEISVIDRRSQTIVESWPIRQHENAPMALDEPNRRVFVVCRKPARLLVLNMDDGAITASMSTVADADDIFYDREHKRIYVVGGEGSLAIYRQKGPDEYFALSRVDTVEEARTGLFVPEWKRLYVVARNRPPLFPAELMSFAILEDQEH